MTDETAPAPFTITLAPAVVAECRDGGVDDYGAPNDYMWPAEFCYGYEDGSPGCGKPIDGGQPVRKLSGEWVHDECARKAITQASVAEAWILLADQVAARPHTFKATEIRAIVQNVARIASAGVRPSGQTGGEQ